MVIDLGELAYSSWRFRRLLVHSSWRFTLVPDLRQDVGVQAGFPLDRHPGVAPPSSVVVGNRISSFGEGRDWGLQGYKNPSVLSIKSGRIIGRICHFCDRTVLPGTRLSAVAVAASGLAGDLPHTRPIWRDQSIPAPTTQAWPRRQAPANLPTAGPG